MGPKLLLVISLAAATAMATALNSPTLTLMPFPGIGNTGPTANRPGTAATLVINPSTFTGTWGANALGPFQGTFTGTGPYPSGANGGPSTFIFSSFSGGVVQSGMFVELGDLDSDENLTLSAFDASNNLILTPWLDLPVFVSGANPADFLPGFMPNYKFAAGVYTFVGEGIGGNPSILISLPTNTAIGSLAVTKDASFGVSLSAPTAAPEPSTYALMGLGLLAAGYRRFRRRK